MSNIIQRPIFISRNWDSHNSNTLIYRTQLHFLGNKNQTDNQFIPSCSNYGATWFQAWKVGIWYKKSAGKEMVVDRLPLVGNGNTSTVLGHCCGTATRVSRVFFRIPGKYWKIQTFFSPGFLLEDIHSNSNTPINNRQAELVTSPQGTTNHECLVSPSC